MQARDRPTTVEDGLKRMAQLLREAAKDSPLLEEAGPERVLALLLARAPGWPVGPGDVEEALVLARSAVELRPDYPPNQVALAEVLLKNDRKPGAQEAIAKAIALARTGALRIRPGRALLDRGGGGAPSALRRLIDRSPIETHTTFCRICESLCGLVVQVDGGRVVDVRADDAHVATRGFACPKGLRQQEIYASPDRLLAPEKRTGDRWDRIGWDQAIGEIGGKVRQIRQDHGPDSIAMYVGTAAGFGVLHPVFAQGFMTGLGSRSMYSSSTQDCSNKFAVAREMYGFPFTQPFPDLERIECLVIVGANPVISKWSFLQVPNPARALQAIESRGGRVFVVDPRRTETARAAGEHVFIRPDTDVFFYLSFVRELLLEGEVDQARLARFTRGLDEVKALCAPWTPERTAEVTRIPPEKLREMVRAFRGAKGAALYSSTGVNMGSNGSLAFWLQEVANCVSGNLDRAGGTLVGRGVIDFAAFGKKTGTLMRTDRSRVGGFQSVNDGFPGGILADEILTPGDRQVRALFVTGGNPLITMANAGRLREAFGKLELLVTLDLFRNETGSVAHYVLPCTSPLERPDLPFVFPLMLGLQERPYLQATDAILPPPGDVRDEATIYLDLCRASGISLFGSRIAQWSLSAMKAVAKRPGTQPSLPAEGAALGNSPRHEAGVLPGAGPPSPRAPARAQSRRRLPRAPGS